MEDSILNKYLDEIGRESLLTEAEERSLSARILRGDSHALNRLIEANLRFVVTIARQYQGQGLTMEDLVSEGNIGLMKAAAKYDATRGLRFVNYAVVHIRRQIEKALKAESAEQRVESRANGQTRSVDAPLGTKNNVNLLSVLADNNVVMADERIYNSNVAHAAEHALTVLNDRESQVMNAYFGIGQGSLTMAEIAEDMGVPRERVRQIRDRAIRRMKSAYRRMLLVAFAAILILSTADARTRKRQESPSPKLTTIEMITKVNDYWQNTHSPKVRSFWDEAAYHTGNMEAYRLLGCARWLDYSTMWARHNQWMGAREQDPAKWKYKNYGEGQDYVLFGDWQICFQTYLDLYEIENGEFKIARSIEVMDYEVRQPQTDFWWWADALYMVMPVFTKLYKTTGEIKYLNKLYDNYRWADELMYDSVEQLYYRDAKYIYPKVKTASGGKSFWARGDGWVLAGLAKVLADMPQDYKNRPFFVQRFRELAEGVARVQRPGGYWSRSMLCEEDAPGPETSGTAFFTYGMLWGVNNGLLDRDTYAPIIEKAWNYLTITALQKDGSVGFVQPIGEKPDPTKTVDARSQANFGVGAFLLAACEHLRYEDNILSIGNGVVTFTIENPSSEFRQQVMEVEASELYSKLGIQGGRQFVILDPASLEVPYQLTYDGKVLIDAGVSPHSTLTFTVQKGMPKSYATVCYGQLYPERKDDYAWENDRGAYRVYGPALQRTGERSYGIDVWSKNTPELVVEQRYWTEDVVMMPTVERLRRENRHYGDSVYRTISYHHDHGRGMDLYRVGATLGCGTPALLLPSSSSSSLLYPYCFESYVILDNGPLRTTVQLNYGKTAYEGDSITEHRIISLDKGSNFCRMTVTYDGLTKSAKVASGVALHSEAYGGKADVTVDRIMAKDYVAYADPTDNPRVNSCLLFVATLYPEGNVQTTTQLFDKPHDGSEGHLIGIADVENGKPFTYYFGSAWSKHDVRTMQEWQQRIEWTLRSLREPLILKIEK